MKTRGYEWKTIGAGSGRMFKWKTWDKWNNRQMDLDGKDSSERKRILMKRKTRDGERRQGRVLGGESP